MPTENPQLQGVPFSDTSNIINTIARDGAVIATGFTDLQTLAQVNAETQPWLAEDKPLEISVFPPETRRCNRLIGRSPTAREKWLQRLELTRVVNHFVCKTTKSFYDDEVQIETTYPTLSLSVTLEIGPGAKGQRLHRDDRVYHNEHRDQISTGYQQGSDVELGLLIAGVQTTVENGATLVIPGSHLWDDERPPKRSEVVYATMQPGEALIFLGSTYHAGGYNTTTDQKRPVHALFFCRGTHRQEENQYLAYNSEEVREWSEEIQKLAGWDVSKPNLGYVDFLSPLMTLSQRAF